MKKKIFSIVLFGAMLVGFWACEEEVVNTPGTISGIVTDKATGEPIRSAGVELSPTGMKTVTGSEGQFEFTELDPGVYTLLITKTGYTDFASSTIEVKPGQTAKTDVQIERLPPALKVVNDQREEISTLDFGAAEADVARSFNIFNDGEETLDWEITKTVDWIVKISKESGSLRAGAIQVLILTIDRNLLAKGKNTTIVHITSNNGSKQLSVEATKEVVTTMPTLSTKPITNKSIATGTVTLNGEILTVGDPAYTERGFVYGFGRNPSLADATKVIVSGTETGDYFINVSSLIEGKTYYVRAYATTPNGTVYGEEVSFEMVPSMPDVSTQAVTNKNISAGTATLNGTIEDLGDLGYTEKGFVYGEMKNPSLSDATKIAVQGTEAGTYMANISNLVENKTYYVRAYATNTKGTVYGEQVSFSTVATMPTVKTNAVTAVKIGAGTAIFNANVLTLGDLGYTERGFVYSNTHNPTVDDTKLMASGTGAGEYSVKATDIAEGATYYVRAYVKNSKGVVYGEEVSFDFIATMPTVRTNAVTAIKVDLGTAIFNANVLTLGDLGYTERGFVYGNAHNPTIDDIKVMASGTGAGEYSVKATGLVENTTYYVRAYVMNSKGVVYGEEVSFDCSIQLPVVSTQAVTNKNIGLGIATLNGRIESTGYPTYTERGFVYGLSPNPSIDDATKKMVSGTGSGSFTTNLSNLVMGNLYYVRAYAISTKGTVYGEEVDLDFYPIYPNVTTTSVKITSATTALASGSIGRVGDPAYKERGFVYGTMPVPTLDNGASKAIATGTQTGDFQASLTNLNSSSVYYVRAYATSNAGTVYGEIETITEDDWTYFNVPTIEYAGYTYKYYVIGTMNYSQAVQNCSNLNLGGFTDWYLPTKEEIAYIVQMSSLAEEKNKVWWTSSRYSSDQHYIFSYNSTNSQWMAAAFNNSTYAYVCAVRKCTE